MSNIFKQHNSRFSILNEDIEPNNKSNNKNQNKNNRFNTDYNNGNNSNNSKNSKNSNNSNNRYNNFNGSGRRIRFQDNCEKSKVIQPPSVTDNVSFPELTKSSVKTDFLLDEQKQSFLEKLKTVKVDPLLENKEEVVKDGWVSITFQNRKTTFKYGKMSYVDYNNDMISPDYVMSSLVNLHEKRKEKYINLWGYDCYEKIFLFPNYDYEYFDKLDEQYDLEMEKLELEENDIDSEEI
jgi:hypothetical protein